MVKNKPLFYDIFSDSHISPHILNSNCGCYRNLISWLSLVIQDFVVKKRGFVADSDKCY